MLRPGTRPELEPVAQEHAMRSVIGAAAGRLLMTHPYERLIGANGETLEALSDAERAVSHTFIEDIVAGQISVAVLFELNERYKRLDEFETEWQQAGGRSRPLSHVDARIGHSATSRTLLRAGVQTGQ